MQANLKYDKESFELWKNGAITGKIYIKVKDYCFPEKEWNDNLLILLNLWKDLFPLTNDSTFRVIDGNYFFTIEGNSTSNSVTFFENEIVSRKFLNVDFRPFEDEIISLSNYIIDKYVQLKGTYDYESLKLKLTEK